MRNLKLFLFSAVAAAAMASPAHAQFSLSNLQVKVGVSAVLPEEKATISAIGGDVDISDEYVPTLQIEYFFTDNISAELLCCMARHEVKAVGTTLGEVDLGKISHFPPTLTAKYHWTDFGAFQPYVGAGANFTRFFDDDETGAVNSVRYDNSWGPALQAGFDYKLDKHWSLNVDVRKVWIQTDVTIDAGPTINADVDINPLIVTIGSGYRF